MKKDYASPLPKRFYSEVTTEKREGGVAVLLDGRQLKTIAKKPLVLPSEALATLVAEEWRAVVDAIVPDAMPYTRLANIAIDRMGTERVAVMQNAMLYAETDLLCHRGREEELRALQVQHWDPVLGALEEFGIKMVTTTGVIPVPQPQASLDAIAALLETANVYEAAALAMLVPLMGSVLLSLAVWKRLVTLDAAIYACRLDEEYQQERWGKDAEADVMWDAKLRDMRACVRWLSHL